MSDKFKGFEAPQENWSKLPHQLIAELPRFTSLGELKVVLYVLRHTWGYRNQQGVPDQYKRISLDEFMNGRKTANGERLDDGTGMTKPTIISGIRRAIKHGFLYSHTDDSDSARTTKYYSLTEQGLNSFTPTSKEVLPPPVKNLYSDHRKKPEKETKKDLSPDESGDEQKPDKAYKDMLFEMILYIGWKINYQALSEKEKLSALAMDGKNSRVGKTRKRLLELKPLPERQELRDFYVWWQKTYPNTSAPQDAEKFLSHFVQFRLENVKPIVQHDASSEYDELKAEQERIAQLKGDNNA